MLIHYRCSTTRCFPAVPPNSSDILPRLSILTHKRARVYKIQLGFFRFSIFKLGPSLKTDCDSLCNDNNHDQWRCSVTVVQVYWTQQLLSLLSDHWQFAPSPPTRFLGSFSKLTQQNGTLLYLSSLLTRDRVSKTSIWKFFCFCFFVFMLLIQ